MSAMPQHLQALARADRHRLGAANFRKEIAALGRSRGAEAARKVADALAERDDEIFGSQRLHMLLKAIPGMGEHGARKCMTAAGVMNAERRVRDLTVRQRNLIAGQLVLWAATRR